MVVRELRLRGSARMASLECQLTQLVQVFRPELIAIEGYSYNSINRPFDLGGIAEIIKLAFFKMRTPVIVVPPTQLKKFVTGDGGASKEKMVRSVLERYNYETRNDNIADAVGLAKFAEIYVTGYSVFRSELDTVLAFKETERGTKITRRYKSVRSI
jgi:Holliday junction resolvasome RuvABC endonuclease subunit